VFGTKVLLVYSLSKSMLANIKNFSGYASAANSSFEVILATGVM
jgi:hypothetical protein